MTAPIPAFMAFGFIDWNLSGAGVWLAADSLTPSSLVPRPGGEVAPSAADASSLVAAEGAPNYFP